MRRILVAAAVVLAVVAGVVTRVQADDGPERNDADVGFLRDMIDHHEQANLLSAIALERTDTPQVRRLALDVIGMQRYEIGVMEGWLIEWGLERGQPGRPAMAWMGMDVPVERMPGMATRAAVDDLATREGRDLDVRYLELLLDHHEGGIHMSEAAAERAANPHVRWLAGQMARNQLREIRDVERLLGRR